MKQIAVAVAVIQDKQGRILLTRRASNVHQGGKWEFPGGKREEAEDIRQTLDRELQEELGIHPTQAEMLIRIPWQYPELRVLLEVFLVTDYQGQPCPAEGQPMQWVHLHELPHIEFPAANRPIISALRLPRQYLITPDLADSEVLYQGILQASRQGIRLIQLRAPQLGKKDYFSLVERLLDSLPDECQLLIKGEPEHLRAYPRTGWHLSSSQLEQLARQQVRPLDTGRWLAASCHNASQLKQAAQIQADFACLSPVQPTSSHPEARPLGWPQTSRLVAQAQLPVYLLGGLQPGDLARAKQTGAQGIAAIRGLWPKNG